jgi:hypothetical protein
MQIALVFTYRLGVKLGNQFSFQWYIVQRSFSPFGFRTAFGYRQIPMDSVADPDPGSGIGYLFEPWVRDPGSGMGESQHQDPGSGMNNPDHIF